MSDTPNTEGPVVPGPALKEARQNASLSQAQAGEIAGVTRQTVGRWEVGEKDSPPEGLQNEQVRYLVDLMKASPENRDLLLRAAGVGVPNPNTLDNPHFGPLVERMAEAFGHERWNQVYAIIDATLRGMIEEPENRGARPVRPGRPALKLPVAGRDF